MNFDSKNVVPSFLLTAILNAILKEAWLLILPALLLITAQGIDYASAVLAAPKRGQTRSSSKGIAGIKKKVAMWILVFVGILIDVAIYYSCNIVGFTSPRIFIFSLFAICIIFINECISICENLNDIYNVPFLNKLLANANKEVTKAVEEKIEDLKIGDASNEEDQEEN